MSLRERRRAAVTLVLVFVLGGFAMATSAAAKPGAIAAQGPGASTAHQGQAPGTLPAPQESAPVTGADDDGLGLRVAASSPARTGRAVDCRKVTCVALTFDDGPGPFTTQVVRSLKAKGARARFFMLGSQVRGREATVRAVKAADMEIGNHSYSHPDLHKLSTAAVRSQMRRTDAALAKAGARATAYRPPYGALNARVRAALSDRPIILWDVDTLDWKTLSGAATLRSASRAPRGAIILMHDIHRSTARAVPSIVASLQAKGYHLVTVSELLRAPRPGKVYTGPYAH